MPAIDSFGPLLLFAVFVPAAAFAVSYGYRSGLKGDPLFHTCLWGWLKVALAVVFGNGLAAFLFTVAGLLARTERTLVGTSLILLFGLGLILLYLPVAGLFALLGHLAGMQRKNRTHLEKLDGLIADAAGPVVAPPAIHPTGT